MDDIGIIGWGTDLSWLKMKTAIVVEKRERDKLKRTSPQMDDAEISEMISKRLETFNFLGMRTKTVAPFEDDSTTFAVQASYDAIKRARINPKKIGIVKVGTETAPYKTGPTIAYYVATVLGASPQVYEEDISNACNGGMQAVRDSWLCVKSGQVKYGLGIGSDVARGAPGSPLEYAVGAGASAWLIGHKAPIVIRDMVPYALTRHLDIDFWVRDGAPTPEVYGDRSTICYTECVICSLALLLLKHPKVTIQDFDNIVPHQPFEYMPRKAFRLLDPSKRDQLRKLLKVALKVEDENLEKRMTISEGDMINAIKPGLLSPEIGNTYSASSQTGASHIFDQADYVNDSGESFFRKGKRILLLSYGSGTRSLAVDLEVMNPRAVKQMVHRAPTTVDHLERMKPISKLGTYTSNLRERIGRVKEQLVHRRIIGEIEPASSETLQEQICDCGTIFYPARKGEWNELFYRDGNGKPDGEKISCVDTDCNSGLHLLNLPSKGKLRSAQILPLHDAVWQRMTTSYDILKRGYVIIVETIFERLYPGAILTTRFKRFGYKGSKGLIQYGIAYAPPVPRTDILKKICNGDDVAYDDLLSLLIRYPEQDLSKEEKRIYWSGYRAICTGNVDGVKKNFATYAKMLNAKMDKVSEAERKTIAPQIERSRRFEQNAKSYECKTRKYFKKIIELD
jgi:hydroxymethylglutaryl-CoA synthase